MRTESPCVASTRMPCNSKIVSTVKELARKQINVHGHSAQRFNDPQKCVCMEDQFRVCEPVLLDVSRFSEKQTLLRGLQAKTQCRKDICLDNLCRVYVKHDSNVELTATQMIIILEIQAQGSGQFTANG